MSRKPWQGAKWPEGVTYDVEGWQQPLFSLLDDSAREYPDAAFTIFQGASRTFDQVKDTADRVAHFLAGPHTGESVKAFIQLKPNAQATEEEILGFCKERMAGYKRPRSVEFRDALPMSAVGKVLRRVLREEERRKH